MTPTPAILNIKAYDQKGQEVWSFCWIEGQPSGSMLQEINGWHAPSYPFSLVCSLVWGWTARYPNYRLTFHVVVPASTNISQEKSHGNRT